MTRLFGIIYALAGPTLAGSLVVAALTMNMVDMRSILIASAVGFVLALPVALIVTKKIDS